MANLKVSAKGIQFIKKHEGEILKVYLDPVGLPTMGVGHLLTAAENKIYKVGQKITKEESEHFLRLDVARFERAVNYLVKVPLNQNQFDALVSFAFNVGESALKNSSLLKKLNNKDYKGAAEGLLAWNKGTVRGKKVVLPGLDRRRKEEKALFLKASSAKTEVPTSDKSKQEETVALSGVIKRGDKGEMVAVLQRYLVALGFLQAKDVDGDFGAKTLKAVKDFQNTRSLKVDGIVGSQTVAAIVKTVMEAIKVEEPSKC